MGQLPYGVGSWSILIQRCVIIRLEIARSSSTSVTAGTDAWATEQPNKEMKLTRPGGGERGLGALQLISGVGRA